MLIVLALAVFVDPSHDLVVFANLVRIFQRLSPRVMFSGEYLFKERIIVMALADLDFLQLFLLVSLT